ncbi:MAG: nuclear transport factor 2 family protein [bacterium]|nr:nuclear transport factor 2 family protein [bacterium]
MAVSVIACTSPPSAEHASSGAAPSVANEKQAVGAVLDDWHDAAKRADEARYMGHFAGDAVFLGTDATERWSREAFGTYVHSYFSRGTGWEYVPGERHVELSRDGSIAWFDEALTNAGYGGLRGSGVLRREGGAWKILQYNLTFTVPNDVARDVVALIRGQDGAAAD